MANLTPETQSPVTPRYESPISKFESPISKIELPNGPDDDSPITPVTEFPSTPKKTPTTPQNVTPTAHYRSGSQIHWNTY